MTTCAGIPAQLSASAAQRSGPQQGWEQLQRCSTTPALYSGADQQLWRCKCLWRCAQLQRCDSGAVNNSSAVILALSRASGAVHNSSAVGPGFWRCAPGLALYFWHCAQLQRCAQLRRCSQLQRCTLALSTSPALYSGAVHNSGAVDKSSAVLWRCEQLQRCTLASSSSVQPVQFSSVSSVSSVACQ